MIDIHSHLIHQVDDGSKSLEESIALLKEAQNCGITDIILTPHYIEDGYEKTAEQIQEKIQQINEAKEEAGIQVNLYQGNEIFAVRNLDEHLYQHRVASLADSQYLLFELPMHHKIPYLYDTIYEILGEGYIPILAHPERYSYIQENPEMLIELMEKGVLFQSNLASILGIYGKKAKKTLILMLKNDMIQFLASDTHRRGTIYQKFSEIEREFLKVIPEDKFAELTKVNPKKILDREEIEIDIPKTIKKPVFWNLLKS